MDPKAVTFYGCCVCGCYRVVALTDDTYATVCGLGGSESV